MDAPGKSAHHQKAELLHPLSSPVKPDHRKLRREMLEGSLVPVDRIIFTSSIKSLTTLRRGWEEILNCLIECITNGFVEDLNGALKAMMRIAFGYGYFHNFRMKAFAESSAFTGNMR